MVKKMCIVNNDEEMEEILKGIEPLLRNKKRSILLMGGKYEEVKMEIEKAIIAYMTSIPKKSAQTKVASLAMSTQPEQAKEIETSIELGGASPTMALSPSYSFEQHVLVSSDS